MILVALVYRAGCKACGRGCCKHAKGGGRQYAFETVSDLAAWCARHPYREEVLRVLVVGPDMKVRVDTILPATEAVSFVEAVRLQWWKEGGT